MRRGFAPSRVQFRGEGARIELPMRQVLPPLPRGSLLDVGRLANHGGEGWGEGA